MPSLKENIAARNEALQELKTAVDSLSHAVELAMEKEGEPGRITTLASLVQNKAEAYNEAAFDYPTVEVDETEYEIVVPEFMRNNVLVTAEDLEDDAEMAAELVEENSNILREKLEASFSYAPENPETGDEIAFTDTTDVGIEVVAWLWDFAGIDTATTNEVYYMFNEPGEYVVTLQATLANGRIISKTQVITVTLAE